MSSWSPCGCPHAVPPADVTDAGSIGAAAGRVQEELRGAGLGLLINNAGARRRSTLETETAENMALLYATNTVGPLQVTQVGLGVGGGVGRLPDPKTMGSRPRGDSHAPPQAFLPLLREAAEAGRGQGLSCSRAAVVNVSSAMGSIGVAAAWGDAQDISYRCSKVRPWGGVQGHPMGSSPTCRPPPDGAAVPAGSTEHADEVPGPAVRRQRDPLRGHRPRLRGASAGARVGEGWGHRQRRAVTSCGCCAPWA